MTFRRNHSTISIGCKVAVPVSFLLTLLLCVAFQWVEGFVGIHSFAAAGFGRTRGLVLGMSEDGPSTVSFPIEKTDEEWKELLTPDQYYILRKEGTETPGASALNQISVEKNGEADAGTFCCAGCGHPLFVADSKYDSGTGWPSFYQPVSASAVALQTDYKLVVPRTEVVCSQCGGHLGHVFEDGPDPTGQRYCMNGAAMTFTRDSESPELANQALQMALEDPYKLSPSQLLPSIVINLVIGGIFFNAFMSSGQSSPIEYLTLLPASYYGFLAAKQIAKMTA